MSRFVTLRYLSLLFVSLLNFFHLVCLRNLHDHGNAFLAFERSVMLPDAVKYPLVYLNFAIYCVQMKRYEMAGIHLAHFFSVSEHTAARHEVSDVEWCFCCCYFLLLFHFDTDDDSN